MDCCVHIRWQEMQLAEAALLRLSTSEILEDVDSNRSTATATKQAAVSARPHADAASFHGHVGTPHSMEKMTPSGEKNRFGVADDSRWSCLAGKSCHLQSQTPKSPGKNKTQPRKHLLAYIPNPTGVKVETPTERLFADERSEMLMSSVTSETVMIWRRISREPLQSTKRMTASGRSRLRSVINGSTKSTTNTGKYCDLQSLTPKSSGKNKRQPEKRLLIRNPNDSTDLMSRRSMASSPVAQTKDETEESCSSAKRARSSLTDQDGADAITDCIFTPPDPGTSQPLQVPADVASSSCPSPVTSSAGEVVICASESSGTHDVVREPSGPGAVPGSAVSPAGGASKAACQSHMPAGLRLSELVRPSAKSSCGTIKQQLENVELSPLCRAFLNSTLSAAPAAVDAVECDKADDTRSDSAAEMQGSKSCESEPNAEPRLPQLTLPNGIRIAALARGDMMYASACEALRHFAWLNISGITVTEATKEEREVISEVSHLSGECKRHVALIPVAVLFNLSMGTYAVKNPARVSVDTAVHAAGRGASASPQCKLQRLHIAARTLPIQSGACTHGDEMLRIPRSSMFAHSERLLTAPMESEKDKMASHFRVARGGTNKASGKAASADKICSRCSGVRGSPACYAIGCSDCSLPMQPWPLTTDVPGSKPECLSRAVLNPPSQGHTGNGPGTGRHQQSLRQRLPLPGLGLSPEAVLSHDGLSRIPASPACVEGYGAARHDGSHLSMPNAAIFGRGASPGQSTGNSATRGVGYPQLPNASGGNVKHALSFDQHPTIGVPSRRSYDRSAPSSSSNAGTDIRLPLWPNAAAVGSDGHCRAMGTNLRLSPPGPVWHGYQQRCGTDTTRGSPCVCCPAGGVSNRATTQKTENSHETVPSITQQRAVLPKGQNSVESDQGGPLRVTSERTLSDVDCYHLMTQSLIRERRATGDAGALLGAEDSMGVFVPRSRPAMHKLADEDRLLPRHDTHEVFAAIENDHHRRMAQVYSEADELCSRHLDQQRSADVQTLALTHNWLENSRRARQQLEDEAEQVRGRSWGSQLRSTMNHVMHPPAMFCIDARSFLPADVDHAAVHFSSAMLPSSQWSSTGSCAAAVHELRQQQRSSGRAGLASICAGAGRMTAVQCPSLGPDQPFTTPPRISGEAASVNCFVSSTPRHPATHSRLAAPTDILPLAWRLGQNTL